MYDVTLFQIVQKLVVLDDNKVLLARRKGESDYDGVYSFPGGKIETTDGGIVEGLKREKDEELGADFKAGVHTLASHNVYFVKSDGHHMFVLHYPAKYVGGTVSLSDEYDRYEWVSLSDLDEFEPKVPNIPVIVDWAVEQLEAANSEDFVEI